MEGWKAQLDSWSCNSRESLARKGPEEPWQEAELDAAEEGEKPPGTCASLPGGKNSFLTPELVMLFPQHVSNSCRPAPGAAMAPGDTRTA